MALLVLLAALMVRALWPAAAVPWLPIPLLTAAIGTVALVAAWRRRAEPAPAPLRRDPGVAVLVAALAVLLQTLLSHDFRITSDGVDHYVYLRSVMEDGDLDLANDYARLSPRGGPVEPPTPTGLTGNVHPVGPAILWAPFYLLADAVCAVTGRPTDGYGYAHRTAVSIGSLLFGWLGLVIVYRTAAPRAGRGPALLAALAIAFATFLWWYLAWAPTMAHAPEFAAAAAFVALWLRPGPRGARGAALLGVACGLAALLRWSSVLLAVLPLVSDLPRLRHRAEWPRLATEALAFAAAALVVFLPQMAVWKLLYGSWLTIPQGEEFVSGIPAWAGVLFSPRKGLFSWSPVLYLGLVGLVPWARRDPWRVAAALVFALLLTRANAGTGDWWGGAAFGGRRFDALLPLLGLGMAVALDSARRLAARRPLVLPALIVAAFTLWNVALADQYRSGAWDYAEPVAFEDMAGGVGAAIDRRVGSPFALPASLWSWLRHGRAPADWESLYMQRRHSRWTVRSGVDDRLFLEDGWSAPVEVLGSPARRVDGPGAGLIVPLHRPEPYRLGARLRAETPARMRVLVNQRAVGGFDVGPDWQDHELDVPTDALVPGRNVIRLRVDAPVAVAGMWMEPVR